MQTQRCVLASLVLASALFSDVDAACTSSTLAGYLCQQTAGSVVMHYTLAADKATVKLAVEASVTGYAALGVGAGMTTSQIVLGFVSSGVADVRALTTSARTLTAVNAGTVDIASTSWVTDASVTESGGKTVTSFTYNLAAGGKITDTSAANFVWSTSSTDAVAKHTAKGTLTVNLDEAIPTSAPPTSAPATTAPPTPAPETAAPLACTASTLAGYLCQQTAGSVVMHYTLAADKATVNLAVEASVTGYAALGVGAGMTTSQIVLGFVSSGVADVRALTTSARTLTAVNAGTVDIASTSWVTDASVTESGGKTVTSFTYNLAAGGKITDTSAANFVWSTSSTDAVAKHTAKGTLTVNLDEALQTTSAPDTSAPATTAPPTPAPETAAPLACTASTLAGYLCQQTAGSVVMHYTLAADKTTVNLAVEASVTGYAALGVGAGMTTSQIVLGFVSSGVADVRALTTSARTLTAVNAGTVDIASTSWVTDASVTESGGKTVTSFTYNLAAGGKITDTSAANFVWSTSSTDAVAKHTAKGTLSVNLDEALQTTSAPATTAPPTPAPETAAPLACTASTLAGYLCQQTAGSVVMHYTLAADKATVKLAVEASVTGYAALGVGAGMTTSQIVLGFVSSGIADVRALTASARTLTAVNAGTVDIASTSWVTDASVTESGGKTVTSFTYNLAAGGRITDTSAANFVWSTSSTDAVAKHTAKGTLTVNLDEAVPAATVAPPTAVPTSVPVGATTAPLTSAPLTSAPATSVPETAAPLACTSSTLAGYLCQQTAGSVVMHYTLAADKATVKLAVEASVTGYAALGVGDGMTTSQIVLGFVSSGVADVRALTTSARTLTAVNAGTVHIASISWVTDASVTESGGKTVTSFTYNLAAGGKITDTSAANFVWSTSSRDTVAIHEERGQTTVNLDQSLPTTAAPAGTTLTPTTPQPATTSTPSTSAPSSCTASTLATEEGDATFDCTEVLDGSVSLHWSILSGSRIFALQGSAAGYLAMGFPESSGTMGPGAAMIVTGGTAAKYAIGSTKSVAAVQLSDAVLSGVSSLTAAVVNGETVMYWTETSSSAVRGAVALQADDILSFNYAYHSSSQTLTTHTTRASVEINLLDGASVDTTAASKQSKVKTHAAIQTAVWAYVVPIAVLAKRFGPLATTAKVSTFPVPFIVHAVLMIIAIVLTIAMAALALAEFDNGTEKGHKGTGITVMCAAIMQALMQVAKPDAESAHRWIFRTVHMVLGLVTMILACVTLFTGADNYERLYANDDSFAMDIRVAAITGLGCFFSAYVLLSALKYVREMKAKKQVGEKGQETTPDAAAPADAEV